MARLLAIVSLLWALSPLARGADRLAEFKKLSAEYDAAIEKFQNAPFPDNPTTADKIRRYEAWPGWQYLPRFVDLAEERPDDEAAYQCCQWIIARTGNVGNDRKPIFDAEQRAWQIVAAHHSGRADLPMLCLQAVHYDGPAQQQFLRELLARQDLTRDQRGFATLALAELLARKLEYCDDAREEAAASPDAFVGYLNRQRSPEWGRDHVAANAEKFKTKSTQLFRDVLEKYADVPVTISAPLFRDLKNLGEKAAKSLHALEHLTIGAQGPAIAGSDLQGNPLDLADYRGKVVVLSFWFTGCGPCVGFIPQERQLIETYRDRPFALLGVCTDEAAEDGRKTAVEHKIEWPCWFDGSNGPIARNWNVLHWPSVYVLDKQGRIAAKDLSGTSLDAKIAELMSDAK